MQFHAYRLARGGLVLDMQSGVLSHLPSRLVAPLLPEAAGEKAVTVLEPVLDVAGTRMVLLVTEMVTIPAKLIPAPPVADPATGTMARHPISRPAPQPA